jgi:hypothetical protein
MGLLKVCDQGSSGPGDVIERVLQTISIDPFSNSTNIGLSGDIKRSRTVEIVGSQKSLNPAKDEGLPPDRIHIATLSSLRPHTALKIAYAQFCIRAHLIGKRLAYGGPDHHGKHYQQMTYALLHGRALALGYLRVPTIAEFAIRKSLSALRRIPLFASLAGIAYPGSSLAGMRQSKIDS